MIDYPNIVGNQEDWANVLTNIEMVETPFLDWLPVGKKPVNVMRSYLAEAYDDPVVNAHIDGKPVTGFKSAGDGRGRLKSLIQYFTKAVAITRLHQDVSDIAGVEDEMAHDLVKRTKELGRDLEVAFLEDDDGVEDNGVVGYKTRGVGSWISNAAQALYPVPPAFRTPLASISTTASGSLTETTILDMLESMGTESKTKSPITAFPGPKMKRAFNAIPFFTSASVLVGGSPTGATGVVYQKNGRTIDRLFERYNSDFGPVDVPGISWYNVFFSTNLVTKAYTTYFLHQKMWELSWGPGMNGTPGGGKPQWHRKEYQGGSYEAFCECIAMLSCLNPLGEGKYQPTA